MISLVSPGQLKLSIDAQDRGLLLHSEYGWGLGSPGSRGVTQPPEWNQGQVAPSLWPRPLFHLCIVSCPSVH